MTSQPVEIHHDENKAIHSNQVLLIDLENCPSQINMLLKDLEHFSQVVICYAQSGAKIPLDWLMPLTAMINTDKLKIVKMPNGGKNAADFGICFLAGMLMQQLELRTHFVIMSEDADLDHTVRLLRSHGRTANRISIKKEEKSIPVVVDMDETVTLAIAYCKKMLLNSANKPSTKTALLNSLKSHCGQDTSRADMIFRYLTQNGIVNLELNDRLKYHQVKLDYMTK